MRTDEHGGQHSTDCGTGIGPHHSVPAPLDIMKLRRKYGASQKAFGIILGFGELTINSYEQGAAPADANVNLLRLVEDPQTFLRLFEARKDRIGPTQRKRIEAALRKEGTMTDSVEDPIEKLRLRRDELRREYGIRRIGVFGSRNRGDARQGSDLDVLVELEHPYKIDLLGFIGLEQELSDELGVKVDLVNAEDLRPGIAERVMAELSYL